MKTRDQERALMAYVAVGSVNRLDQEDYKIAVHAFGAEILQSGLVAAMSGLERRKEKGDLLRKHLAKASIPGLIQPTDQNLPEMVRALDTGAYILATRETLQIVRWLTRAAQATFSDAKDTKPCETT